MQNRFFEVDMELENMARLAGHRDEADGSRAAQQARSTSVANPRWSYSASRSADQRALVILIENGGVDLGIPELVDKLLEVLPQSSLIPEGTRQKLIVFLRETIMGFTDTLLESAELALNRYAAAAPEYFGSVAVMRNGTATHDDLKNKLFSLSKEEKLIDLLILTHGSDNEIAVNGGITGDKLRQMRAEFGKPLSIRSVYMMNCVGSSLNQAWIDAGAKVSSGAIRNNYLPEPMTFFFWQNWKQGQNFESAVTSAYRKTINVMNDAVRVFISGLPFPGSGLAANLVDFEKMDFVRDSAPVIQGQRSVSISSDDLSFTQSMSSSLVTTVLHVSALQAMSLSRPASAAVKKIDFGDEGTVIEVPVTEVGGHGEAAGEREVDAEINALGRWFGAYWDNFHAGLNNFESGMSFASDQETESKAFEEVFKEVAITLLEKAAEHALKAHPVLAVVWAVTRSAVSAWKTEAERVAKSVGERRIAEYISDLRQQAGAADGPQQRMLRALDQSRPRLLEDYRASVKRSLLKAQGRQGRVVGEAARFILDLRKATEGFHAAIPSPAVFAQHLAERFGGVQVRAGYISHGDRIGGKLYITAGIAPKDSKGATPWKLASVGAAWEWVSVAPKPDRLATVLRTALQQQGKKIWQTNLPKEVRLKVDEAVTGPNPTHDAFIDFDDDPERFRSRNYFRVRGPEASEIWRTRTIRDAVLAIGKLVGVAH